MKWYYSTNQITKQGPNLLSTRIESIIYAIVFSGTALPQYITNRIQENERKYAGTNKVSINELHLQYGVSAITYFQQRDSAIFTYRMDDTYDAYEKDIAMVSFFFKKNTLFEFKR